MITYFSSHYRFYTITPKMEIESFVSKYFRELNGKMYRPPQMNNELIVAFDKDTDISKIRINPDDCSFRVYNL